MKDNVSWGGGQIRGEVFHRRGLFMPRRREEVLSEPRILDRTIWSGEEGTRSLWQEPHFRPVLQIQTFDVTHKWSHTHAIIL